MSNPKLLVCIFVFVSSTVSASYVEICRFNGIVKTEPIHREENTYFVISVETSVPASCHGASSYNKDACSKYTGKTIDIALTSFITKNLKKNSNLDIIRMSIENENSQGSFSSTVYKMPIDCKNNS